MEVKATLNKPYTEEQRIEFIIEYNRNHNYFIEERQDCLVALWYTEEELEEIEKSKKIEEINKRIKELEDLFSNDILYNNGTSKEIYTEIINGLIETRNKIMFSVEEIDNEEIEEEN